MKRLPLLLISVFLVGCISNVEARNTKDKPLERHSSEFERREVKCVIKDGDGDIIAIGGDWGRVSSADAIEDIKRGTHKYYVKEYQVESLDVEVHVVRMKSGKEYLRTNPNGIAPDNLDNLPLCN